MKLPLHLSFCVFGSLLPSQVGGLQTGRGSTSRGTSYFNELDARLLATRGYVAGRPNCAPLVISHPLRSVQVPPGGRGYVATRPTCGPPLILSPALNEVLATPKATGVM